ncbi:hypothetical protein [Acinetobacter nectaris]|uniref:hypothetical protein n=1 Tax=Acinetobacter nectaris TaxID=1219382 RepID=UPI001F199061|nr:hypothetical protein [Acinetobacter nectaris]
MKKHSVIIGAIIGLSAMSIHAKTYVLTDTQNNIEVGNWKTAGQNYTIEQKESYTAESKKGVKSLPLQVRMV